MIERIIVADDEGIQREGLTEILKKILPKAEVIACVNGRQAYEEIKRGGAQVLLTDICMPDMDGIELMEKVSREYPKVRIVAVSAYQEFDYVRCAMRCGAQDYLLKPFRVKDARRLMEQIKEELKADEEKEARLYHYDYMVKQEEESRQKDIIKRVVAGYEEPGAVPPESFPELRTWGNAVVIRWKELGSAPRGECTVRGLLEEQMQNAPGKEKMLELEQGIDRQEHKWLVLFAETQEENIISWLHQVQDNLREQNILFWGGIGERQDNLLESLPEAVSQAEEALSWHFYRTEESGVVRYEEIREASVLPLPPLNAYETSAREAVRRGDAAKLGEVMAQLEKEILTEPLCYPNKLKHRISSMCLSLLRGLEGMIPQKSYDTLLNDAYDRYALCDSLQNLFIITRELLDTATGYFVQALDSYDAVEQCLTYIREHISEDLSLQTLADLVHFHPAYLSAQIKNRLGGSNSFSGYVMTLRMELACRLLTETDCRVLDIAAQCGFKDSSYFNRVFRREYQISPEQYRKMHRACNKE